MLEPAGALPVVVEDDAFVGGLCGLFEGVVVRRRAVLAPGVLITASTRIYDLVNEPGAHPGGARRRRGGARHPARLGRLRPGPAPLREPPPASSSTGTASTDASTALEEALR